MGDAVTGAEQDAALLDAYSECVVRVIGTVGPAVVSIVANRPDRGYPFDGTEAAG